MKRTPSAARPNGWQVSPPRTLYANPLTRMVASRVRCDRTRSEKEFYRFEFTDWVNVIATTATGRLVVIRQYRFGTDRVELEIPGGAINPGEEPVAAGLRELLEETGYAGEKGRVIGKVCPNPAIQNNFCYTVLVEAAERVAEPQQDDMEDIEVATLSLDEVKNLVSSGSIEHGLVLNGLMFFALDMDGRS